jgi:hypothetical protein
MIDLYDPRGKNVTQLKVALSKGEAQMRVLEEQRASINTAIEELERTISVVREMLAESLTPLNSLTMQPEPDFFISSVLIFKRRVFCWAIAAPAKPGCRGAVAGPGLSATDHD